jgi:hypothetical protein
VATGRAVAGQLIAQLLDGLHGRAVDDPWSLELLEQRQENLLLIVVTGGPQ